MPVNANCCYCDTNNRPLGAGRCRHPNQKKGWFGGDIRCVIETQVESECALKEPLVRIRPKPTPTPPPKGPHS